ncbi:MAG: RluA family pseudouridine synthase [Anaerovoracaceae bacterium]
MVRDFKYIVTEEDFKSNLAITAIMKQKFDFSSRLRTKIKKNEGMLLNGNKVPSWIVPKPGDEITIIIPTEKSHFEPENIPINIIYQDADLLILNKQPGIVVHPTNGHPCHTLANGVAKYMIDNDQHFKIRFINRLDMDTSGLLALAKNSHSQDSFVKQMKVHKVKKQYLAIVIGIIENDHGTIDLPIGRPDPNKIARAVTPEGSPCVTHYEVIQRYNKGYTLVKLTLETGRTHQIRVHLSHIGYPIVGDHLYGGEKIHLIERQALHAAHLSFYHPVTNAHLKLDAPLPTDMAELLKKLEKFNG